MVRNTDSCSQDVILVAVLVVSEYLPFAIVIEICTTEYSICVA